MHLLRANTGYGLTCLKCKVAKLCNELGTELKEETSPTQFKVYPVQIVTEISSNDETVQ